MFLIFCFQELSELAHENEIEAIDFLGHSVDTDLLKQGYPKDRFELGYPLDTDFTNSARYT